MNKSEDYKTNIPRPNTNLSTNLRKRTYATNRPGKHKQKSRYEDIKLKRKGKGFIIT